jgi:hypothetical protein
MRDAETSRIKVTGWRGNRTWAKGQKKGKTKTCTEVQAEFGTEAELRLCSAANVRRIMERHAGEASRDYYGSKERREAKVRRLNTEKNRRRRGGRRENQEESQT